MDNKQYKCDFVWNDFGITVYMSEIDVDEDNNSSKLRIDRIYWSTWNTDSGRAFIRDVTIYLDGTLFRTGNVMANWGYTYVPTMNVSAGYNAAETTQAIVHDADGSRSVSIEASATWVFMGWDNMSEYSHPYARQNVTSINDDTSVTSIELTDIPRGASLISAEDGILGSENNISYNYRSDSFQHELKCKIGSGEYFTVAEKCSDREFTVTIDLDAAEDFPTMNYVPVTFRLDTYAGDTFLGSSEKTVKQNIPSSIIPSITDPVYSDETGKAQVYGGYIQTVSRLQFSVKADGNLGSYITSARAAFDNREYVMDIGEADSDGNVLCSFLSSEITKSGEIDITATVTDSRGRTASQTVSITVLEYSIPKIVLFDAYRPDDQDDVFCASWQVSYSAITGAGTVVIDYCQKGQDYSGAVTYTTNTGTRTQSGILSDKSYRVRIRANDGISETSATEDLPTAFATIDLKEGGKGVAVGGMCDTDRLEVYLDAVFKGSISLKIGNEEMTLEQYIRSIVGQ